MEAVVESAGVQRAVGRVGLSAGGAAPYPPAPSLGDVLGLLDRVPFPADGAGMIEQIRCLEDLKSLAAARQAEISMAFDLSQRREQAAAGVPAEEQGSGVAAQIALARRESPARGSRLLWPGQNIDRNAPHVRRVPQWVVG